jgi:hypothetical protein
MHVNPKHGSFKQLPVGMRGAHADMADSAMAFCRHSHEQFGIGLMERGGHRSSSGRGIVEAGPGDVITVNPAEVHDGAPIGSTGRSWRMLYLDPSLIALAASDIAEPASWRGEFSTPVVHDRRLAVGFARLFHAATQPAASPLQLDEALLRLLARGSRRRADGRTLPSLGSRAARASITPSGTPHLGNCIGMIKPAVAMSAEDGRRCFYFISDLHALVKCHDAEHVGRFTLGIAAAGLATPNAERRSSTQRSRTSRQSSHKLKASGDVSRPRGLGRQVDVQRLHHRQCRLEGRIAARTE